MVGIQTTKKAIAPVFLLAVAAERCLQLMVNLMLNVGYRSVKKQTIYPPSLSFFVCKAGNRSHTAVCYETK